MAVYNLIIVLCGIFSLFDCFNKRNISTEEKNNFKMSIIYKILFFILFIVSALRNTTVGTDLHNYIYRFDALRNISTFTKMKDMSEIWGFEIGFTIFCKLVTFLSNNNQIFMIVTSFIIIFGFYKFIQRFSIIPILSILVMVAYGYWGNSMNIVRQSMSIGLIALSISLYKSKKLKSALFFYILACSFHISSAIMILVIPLNKCKYTDKALIGTIIVSVVFFLLPKNIIEFLLKNTTYGWYIGRDGSGESTLLVFTLLLIISYFRKKKIEEFDENIDFWLWLLSFAIFFNVLALNLGLFERIMRFFLISFIIILPDVLYTFRNKKYYILICICIISILFIYFYFIIMSSYYKSGGIIPYEFFFN